MSIMPSPAHGSFLIRRNTVPKISIPEIRRINIRDIQLSNFDIVNVTARLSQHPLSLVPVQVPSGVGLRE